MIRITRETDYGIVLMASMARNPDQSHSAAALAIQRRLPVPMVSKILKTLTRAGLLVSRRGAQGGYSLARSPQAISVAEIIRVLEGPIALTDCSTQAGCSHQDHCTVGSHLARISATVEGALQGITLWDLAQPPAEPVRFMERSPVRVLSDGIV
ncbi:MAG: SUF system Fe-S cluster assembly regulator [Candidatus Competibacteraceae bacterium]|nr:SUF system Fe-S cluster assembly regulator [Candidatus Competibacteraceae bacterium]